ncbi:G5 domain-containing protein [Herbiconiux moechotypicola]|uniref:G5 domain-containing protein n=1 Tax=Herbiconiux moechotypicola TaxID=637393 RepID=A0ABN3E753_9MICO|nr:G5 domain-containing protein [Herbiconiux moechotypicola]MCS5732031.1 G5 domain-containing protein [Herbiconiux moechotypicola]
MTTAPKPAGWYPDPSDSRQQRYWDGTRWTEFTTAWNDPNPATPPLAPVTPAKRERRTRTAVIVGAAAAAVLVIGSIVGVQASSRGGDGAGTGDAVLVAESVAPASATPKPTATPAPAKTPTPTPTPTPVTTVQRVETSEAIGFGQTSYDDPNVDAGTNVIVTAGANGTKVSTWEITLVDGVETGRALVSEVITVAPVDEVTAIGTRQAPPPPPAAAEPAPDAGGGCDPNYAGACVPIASDVDCAGGSGNGPAYVAGPVQVIGSDIYDLDRDGDGIACD